MSSSAPFALFTAFTSDPFGGNPAAVVFLDTTTTPLTTLQGLAKNFNQPMVAFVQPPISQSILLIEDSSGEEPTVRVRTSIRYITFNGAEVGLCGHASLCAASAILALPEYQTLTGGRKVGLVEFEAMMAQRLVPVRVLEDGCLELGLPIAPPVKPNEEERRRVEELVQRAFQIKVGIREVLVGTGDFKHALLVELDPEAKLATAQVDVHVFVDCGYTQNILTSLPFTSVDTTSENAEYIYRIFTPYVPGGEDPVCGSAQCLLAPYWYSKKGLKKRREITTIAASPRRGVVSVTWVGGAELEDERVLLKGTTTFLGKGQCYY